MKKIDLHIHTQSGVGETEYELSMEVLSKYIENEKLDAIAITNHNLFDIVEYEKITEHLDIKVFPGVEIDLEKGHILIICEPDKKEELSQHCSILSEYIVDQNSSLSIEEFLDIFPEGFLSDSLLIPHYKKDPIIRPDVLEKLNEVSRINVGEVKNPKSFINMIKDDNETFTPLLFSDYRASDTYQGNNDSYRVRQTYMSIDDISINSMKICFIEKGNKQVALSKKEGNNLFELNNGLTVSTGLNVIIGKRSSGKTYFLNSIYNNSDNDLIKYIKQFELIEKDEKKQKEVFNKSITQSNSRQRQNYLKEFSDVVDKALDINDLSIIHSIDEYLNSLKDYAVNSEIEDVYSKTNLFRESNFLINILESLEQLIKAVLLLIENNEYKNIIESHLDLNDLKNLLIQLIDKYRKLEEENVKIEQVNNIIESVKSELQLETTAPSIKELNFDLIAERNLFINKFNALVNMLKKEQEVHNIDVGNYRNVAIRKKYNRVSEINDVIPGQYKLSDLFNRYYESDPYKYLKSIDESARITQTDIYKAFVNIEISILNSNGYPVSGGQMAEYNFLQKIDGALEHDVLLIDEPESSFDNVFLNQAINRKIKAIAQHIPVFISTHNSTVGMSIQPDYLLYTKDVLVNGKSKFHVFAGTPKSDYLISKDDEKHRTLDALITCLEAGNDPYEKRREVYDLLKDIQ